MSSLQGFDEATQRELAEFLDTEQSKARLQSTIHEHTARCWDVCLKGTRLSTQLTNNNVTCLDNCVNRFMDASLHIVNQLQKNQGGGM